MSATKYQLKHPVEAMQIPDQETYPQDQLSAYVMAVTEVMRWANGKTITSAHGLCVLFSPIGDDEVLTEAAQPGEWIVKYTQELEGDISQVRLTNDQFNQLFERVEVV